MLRQCIKRRITTPSINPIRLNPIKLYSTTQIRTSSQSKSSQPLQSQIRQLTTNQNQHNNNNDITKLIMNSTSQKQQYIQQQPTQHNQQQHNQQQQSLADELLDDKLLLHMTRGLKELPENQHHKPPTIEQYEQSVLTGNQYTSKSAKSTILSKLKSFSQRKPDESILSKQQLLSQQQQQKQPSKFPRLKKFIKYTAITCAVIGGINFGLSILAQRNLKSYYNIMMDPQLFEQSIIDNNLTKLYDGLNNTSEPITISLFTPQLAHRLDKEQKLKQKRIELNEELTQLLQEQSQPPQEQSQEQLQQPNLLEKQQHIEQIKHQIDQELNQFTPIPSQFIDLTRQPRDELLELDLFSAQKLIFKHVYIQQQLLKLLSTTYELYENFAQVYAPDTPVHITSPDHPMAKYKGRIFPYGNLLYETMSNIEQARSMLLHRSMQSLYFYHKEFQHGTVETRMLVKELRPELNPYHHVLYSYESIARAKLIQRHATLFLLYLQSIVNDTWWENCPKHFRHNFQGLSSLMDELAFLQAQKVTTMNNYTTRSTSPLKRALQMKDLPIIPTRTIHIEPILCDEYSIHDQFSILQNYASKHGHPLSLESFTLTPQEIQFLTPSLNPNEVINYKEFPQNDISYDENEYEKATVDTKSNIPRTDWYYSPTPKFPTFILDTSSPIPTITTAMTTTPAAVEAASSTTTSMINSQQLPQQQISSFSPNQTLLTATFFNDSSSNAK